MKTNFSLKIKKIDILIITICLIISIFLVLFITNKKANKRTLNIYVDNTLLADKLIDIDSLESEISITLLKKDYNKLNDDVIIKANKEKGICIDKVVCNDYTCKKMGWVNINNVPITCVINKLVVVIKDDNNSSDIIIK